MGVEGLHREGRPRSSSADRRRSALTTDDEFLRIELRGLEPVPADRRHGRPRELFFIWAGALADFFSLFAGALLISSAGLGFGDAALVLIAGAAAGAAFLGLLSVTGVRSGAPQIVQSRMVFGRRGAAVGGLLTMLIAIGWFAYDCAIAVTTIWSRISFAAIRRVRWIRPDLEAA